MFKTIEKNVSSTIIEKKSKFIANIIYIESEKEAEEELNKIRKKYHDARHNCYAYRITTQNGIVQKQSDDGEPSGTAGAPMLDILEKKEIMNVIVIVTRYFGGILLGTGGLVKAYSEALTEALKKACYRLKEEGYVAEVIIGYENIKDFEYFCLQNDILIVQKEYTDKIKLTIEISKKKVEKNLIIDFQKFPVKILKEKNITLTKHE